MIKKFNSQALAWLGLLALMLIECAIFKTYITREIVPFYPKSYDQAAYLAESYKIYEQMLAKDRIFSVLLHHHLLPQTLLFHVQAGLIYLLFGANRITSLFINFAYFAVLQLFAFSTLKYLTGRYRYGFIFIGMLLAAKSLFMAGDFRIDFIASCLYGILCFAILRSNVFLSRKWTLISAMIAILLVTMRYVTICYVLGMLGVVGIIYLLLWGRGANQFKQQNKTRIINMAIYGGCILLVVVPLVWLNWDLIQSYYVVGHATGAEKSMRLKDGLKLTHLNNAYLYYPVVFFNYHFSDYIIYQLFAALLICWIGVSVSARNKVAINKAINIKIDYKNALILLVVGVLIPLLVLTMDDNKSILVINVILVPFVILLLFVFAYLFEGVEAKSKDYANKSLFIVCGFFILMGIYNYAFHFSHERGHAVAGDKDFVVTRITEDIGNYAAFLGWRNITQAADYLVDYINAPLTPFYYEMHGVYFDVITTSLGNSLMSTPTRQQAFDALKQADIYTVNLSHFDPDKIYPFDHSIKPFRAELQKTAAKNLVVLGDYVIENNHLRVYVRPDANIQMANDIMLIQVPAVVAQQVNKMQLEGGSSDKNISLVSAEAVVDSKVQQVTAKMTLQSRHYIITISMPSAKLDKPVLLQLAFSKNAASNMTTPTKKTFIMREG